MVPSRRKRSKQREWILWGVPLAMVAVSGILIASTQRQADYANWYHHWITAAVGVVVAWVLQRVPLQRLQGLLIPLYGLTVASLVAVRLIGTTALGAQRWISIGGLNVQPSEFAKIAAILLVAAVLSRHPVERPVDLLRPLGVISIPWLLVFIQPDLGTSLVFGALMLTMLYWSGMPFEWVVLLLSPLLTVLLSLQLPYGKLHTRRRARNWRLSVMPDNLGHDRDDPADQRSELVLASESRQSGGPAGLRDRARHGMAAACHESMACNDHGTFCWLTMISRGQGQTHFVAGHPSTPR